MSQVLPIAGAVVPILAVAVALAKLAQSLWRHPELAARRAKDAVHFCTQLRCHRQEKMHEKDVDGMSESTSASTSDDLLDEVAQNVDRWRLHVAGLVAWFGWLAACLRGVAAMYIIAFESAESMEDLLQDELTHDPTSTIAEIFLFLFGVFGALFPKTVICKRMLPVYHWTGMVALSASVSPLVDNDGEVLVGSSTNSELLCLLLGGICLDGRTPVLSNFLLTLSAITGYAYSTSQVEGESTLHVVAHQLYPLCLKVALLNGAFFVLRFQARKEIEAERRSNHWSAVLSLLEMTCDAVVDLDANFLLKAHAPKFASLLLHESRKSLKGLALSDFVVEGQDRSTFLDTIKPNSEDGMHSPSPSMFSIHFRDAMGGRVKFIVFHVPYSIGSDRVSNHLIGVREDTDLPSCCALRQKKSTVGQLMPKNDVCAHHADMSERSRTRKKSRDSKHGMHPVSEVGHTSTNETSRSYNSEGSDASEGCSDNVVEGRESNGSEDCRRRNRSVRRSSKATNLIAQVTLDEELSIVMYTEEMKDSMGLSTYNPCFRELLAAGEGDAFMRWIIAAGDRVRTGLVQGHTSTFGRLHLLSKACSGSSNGGEERRQYHVQVCFPQPATADEAGGYQVTISLLESKGSSQVQGCSSIPAHRRTTSPEASVAALPESRRVGL